MGDLTGYWLARKYGYEMVHRLKADRSRYYQQMERYLDRHVGWTIFITRFAGSLDPVVNLLSGLARISWSKFFFYDCLGNILETGIVLQFGYLASDYWGAYSYVLGLLEAAIIIGVLWSAAWNAYLKWRENIKSGNRKKNNKAYNWYKEIKKPKWAPPGWLFGPVWTILYLGIAATFGGAGYMWFKDQISLVVLLPFILNLIFNLIFNPIQFSLKNMPLALLDVTFTWLTLVWAIIAIWPHVLWIAYGNLPYLAWISFALILQARVTYLNRK